MNVYENVYGDAMFRCPICGKTEEPLNSCDICGRPTRNPVRCGSCWGKLNGLDEFLKSPAGRAVVASRLAISLEGLAS